jgi:flagellar biosynthesis activator protein FlaF
MHASYARQQMAAVESASPQEIEGMALITAARRIADAKRAADSPAALLHALRQNWQLWTIFQAELCAPECTVPTAIRQNLLSLANFIDKKTIELLRAPDPNKVDVLVNINRQIAGGLMGK